jgi:hypothetical protein
MNIGDKVSATITENGYFKNYYVGTIVGFTKNDRVKVKSYRGIKMHTKHNIKVI